MTINGVIPGSPNRIVILPNSVAFGADYEKVVKNTQILLAAEM